MGYYKELNLRFFDALNQIFKINKHRTWSDLSKEITLERISETYDFFGQLFPVNLDRYAIVPKSDPKKKLTSIFHGTLDGITIINNIARYSLYCDDIIVFHPLQNPNFVVEDKNPVKNPNLWKTEFVNALYFYIVLQKWVKADLVHIIENPFNFDQEAKKKLNDEAENRISAYGDLLKDPEIFAEHHKLLFEKFKTVLLGHSREVLEKTIQSKYPYLPIHEVKQIAYELKQYERTLPLYVEFEHAEPAGLIINKTGGNLEMIDALCNLTGGHSYSTQKFMKKQLELRGVNPFWTKFSILYSGLELTYLDSVNTDFALSIRKEDRISGLRQSLRDLSSFLASVELDKIPEDAILNFNDQFKHEVKQSEVEWQKIINSAQRTNSIAVASGAIGALVDPTKIILPALGISSTFIINEIFKQKKLNAYRRNSPHSVFVDLKNTEPSFFSDLKNCIF